MASYLLAIRGKWNNFYHSSSSLLLNFALMEKNNITHHIASNHPTKINSTIFSHVGNPPLLLDSEEFLVIGL
jgi:hypothetical protein